MDRRNGNGRTPTGGVPIQVVEPQHTERVYVERERSEPTRRKILTFPVGVVVSLVVAVAASAVAYGALRSHVEDQGTIEKSDQSALQREQFDHEIRIRAVEQSEEKQDNDLDNIRVHVIWQDQATTAIARKLGITLPAAPIE